MKNGVDTSEQQHIVEQFLVLLDKDIESVSPLEICRSHLSNRCWPALDDHWTQNPFGMQQKS